MAYGKSGVEGRYLIKLDGVVRGGNYARAPSKGNVDFNVVRLLLLNGPNGAWITYFCAYAGYCYCSDEVEVGL